MEINTPTKSIGLKVKIKVKGEHTLAGIRQAVFEKLHEAEQRYGVRFSIEATLYIRPSNGFGADTVPRRRNGEPIKCLYSTGPYTPAAEEYDA